MMNNYPSIKNNKLLLSLSLLFLLFSLNFYLDFLLHFIIIGLVLYLPFKKGLPIYAFVSIWFLVIYQEQYQPFIYLFELVIFIKSLLVLHAENIKLRIRDVFFILFLSGYVLSCVVLFSDLSALRFLFCVYIVFCLRMYYIKTSDDSILREVFKFYLVSVIVAALFGFLHQEFMAGRFSGTHAPNFMGLYLNVSLIILLTTDILRKQYKLLAVGFVVTSLLLTKSTSELAIAVTIISIFSVMSLIKYRHKIKTKQAVVIPMAVAVMMLVVFLTGGDSLEVGAIERVQERVEAGSSSLTLDTITNNRASLWAAYFELYFDFGFIRNMFGSAIFTPIEHADVVSYSHNTYIDLLWFFGAVGIVVLFINIILNLFDYRNSKYFNALLLIKLALVINMISMSLLTSRFYYIMLFL